MDRRHVLTVTEGSGPVGSLRLVETPVPSPGPDEVVVDVVCAAVDLRLPRWRSEPHVLEGAFVGRTRAGGADVDAPGSLVAGIGPIADRVCVPRADLRVLDVAGMALETLALLPIAATIVAAFRAVRLVLGEQVCVSGDGMVARLAAQLAEVSTGRPVVTVSTVGRARAGLTADDLSALVVDATADEEQWKAILPLAQECGRALLLLPGGPQVHPFDFYPAVHLRSLVLAARRVPDAASWRSASDATVEALRRLLARRGLNADAAAWVHVRRGGPANREIPLGAETANGGLVVRFESP